MSSAGQANEAGSVFRRDAAVYFAVHAIAGTPVGSLPNSSPVTRIDFETADPTDDIRISHQDGTRYYVSAKRAAGLDGPTRSTVEGWVEQLSTLNGGDLLVLAVASSTGTLRDLQQALANARAGDPRPVDVTRLVWLDDLVPVQHRAMVRERAHIVEFMRTSTSNDARSHLVMMMNNLVEDHNGAAALDCLGAHLHDTAGLASGSGVGEWVALLEAEGFRLRPAAAGSSAVRYAKAIDTYHKALTKEQGTINFGLLADDLDPLLHQDLLNEVRVTDASRDRSTSRQLLPLVRRKRRLLIVGQPGTGKTKTLWELAASCVQDANAPEPIRVKLSRLVESERPDSLVLADLVAEAANLVPDDDRAHVRAYLQQAALRGDAILILDGLDECGDRASWTAQELTGLVAGLHSETGVVLATRPSAEMPARRLKLDEVVLETPHDLKKTMDAVLDHCATTRIDEPERTAWLAGRRAWLRKALDEHEEMLGVPQLALLVVLLAAESPTAEVPRSRADVLHRAVLQSVERWELSRFAEGASTRWSPELSPAILIDGFITLGRLLDGQPEQPKAAALAALTAMLRDPEGWGEAPARATELAREVLRFWDEHLGVFTIDEADLISARSKVFCEVATAMWVSRCSDAELQAWVEGTVPFYDAQGVLSLAQGLDARVSAALLGVGETNQVATLAVGNAIVADVRQPDADGLERLVGQLVRHALDVERGDAQLPERMNRPGAGELKAWQKRKDRGPESWPLVEALCALEVPDGTRQVRNQALSDLQLAQPYRDIARATAALVDARADSRALTRQELRDVQAVVDIDIPEPPERVQRRRNVFVVPESTTPRGLSIVAELATDHLDELAAGSDQKLYQLSQQIDFRNSFKVVQRLKEAGVEVKPWGGFTGLAGLITMFTDQVERERTLLDDIAGLGERETELTKADRWSLRELADLLHATGYDDLDFREFRRAFTDDTAELRRRWLRTVAVVHGLDLNRLAAQAQHLLNVAPDDTAQRISEWFVISERPARPARRPDFSRMGDDEQQAALAGLFAYSTWLVHSSTWILFQTTAAWDREKLFNEPLDNWAPIRSSTFRQVAIIADPPSQEMLERAVFSEHSAYRHAALRAIKLIPSLDANGTISTRLAADPDQWVRGDLSSDPAAAPAEYWSCRWCPTRNRMDIEECSGCDHGTRPRLDN